MVQPACSQGVCSPTAASDSGAYYTPGTIQSTPVEQPATTTPATEQPPQPGTKVELSSQPDVINPQPKKPQTQIPSKKSGGDKPFETPFAN
jgi:hypothetical protein